MPNRSPPKNGKIILFAAAMLIAGTSITFAQSSGAGGGAGGAAGGTGGTAGGAAGVGGGAAPGPPPTPSATPSVVNPSNPNTASQPSYTPSTPSGSSTTPSTPSTASSGRATSPATEESPNTTARSERRGSTAKKRLVHHHAVHPRPVAYACGYLGCARTYAWAFPCQYYSRYCSGFGYTAMVRWWPGYYDFASGEVGRPKYLGRGYRVAGYHGD